MRDVDAILDELYVGRERVSIGEIYRRAVSADLPAELITALDSLPEGEYAQDEVSEALNQVKGPNDLTDSDPEEPTLAVPSRGVPGSQLDDDDLLREMGELHRTRNQTLRHGSDQALARHDERLTELEGEYRRRFPDREVDPERLRSGARQRTAEVRPLEESAQVARAVDDDSPVAALAYRGPAPDDPSPDVVFREPSGDGADEPAAAGGGTGGDGEPAVRTGAEQEWDPADLAVAEGRDPTPANVERARRELADGGPAAIERTVP